MYCIFYVCISCCNFQYICEIQHKSENIKEPVSCNLMLLFKSICKVTNISCYLLHASLSDCLSIRVYWRNSHWMDVCEILCCGLLWISDRELQIWLKLDQNMRHFAQRSKYIYCYQLYKFTKKASFCNSVFVLLTVACSSTIYTLYNEMSPKWQDTIRPHSLKYCVVIKPFTPLNH